MPRGIFRLKQVYEEQLSGQWSTKGDVWISPSPFSAPSPVPFGYWTGGRNPSTETAGITTIDRLDFSNDSANTLSKGSFSSVVQQHAATSSSVFGYLTGGIDSSPGSKSFVQRLDFSNDTSQMSLRGPLSYSIYTHSSVGNINFGYVAGGYDGGALSTVSRIDYGNDTATSVVKGPLSESEDYLTATGNQSFGYITGGGSTSNGRSTVIRIDYGNDTATASPKGPLSVPLHGHNASSNSSFGYFAGGSTPSNSFSTTVTRIQYSNDTATASTKGPINGNSIYYQYHSATSNQNFGYHAGYNQGILSKIDYSNDTANAAVAGGTLSHGYGGSTSRYDSAALSRKALGLPDTSNILPVATNFGYFGGGSSLSSIDRIDYTNDTATAVAKGPLSVARDDAAGTGNSLFGYFGGGEPGPKSTVDRIDYSNDTATAVAKGPLSAARAGI